MSGPRRPAASLLALLALLLPWLPSRADVSPTPAAPPSERLTVVPSTEPGWPQWRGPRRDGRCDETGLRPSWPPGGPPLLWSASGLGRGYSSPIISGGRIWITGDFGDELRILCLDLSGRIIWTARNGRSWTGPYPGARASCALLAGRVYHRNAHGRVVCLDARTGSEIWAVDTEKRFGGRAITWGISECLLVDGDRVFVTAGGTKALVAALDAKTGRTLWATRPLEAPGEEGGSVAERTSYASSVLCERGDQRLLVGTSLRHHFAVDARAGRLLFTRPLPTRHSVIAMTPVPLEDGYFVTAPDTEAGGRFRLLGRGGDLRVERVWASALDTCHGGAVLVDGTLHGSWYRRKRRGWAGLDARTGELRHEVLDIAKGSTLWADGRLYCLSEEREVALLEPSPRGYRYHGRFSLPPARWKHSWAHPVILGGRLYLRCHDTLYCHDVRAPRTAAVGFGTLLPTPPGPRIIQATDDS